MYWNVSDTVTTNVLVNSEIVFYMDTLEYIGAMSVSPDDGYSGYSSVLKCEIMWIHNSENLQYLTSNTSRPAKCMVEWEVAAMPGWKSWALAVKMPKIETRKKAKEIPMILIINLAGKNCRETYKTSKHEIRFQNTSLLRHSLWKLFENNVSVYKQRQKIWSILDRLTDFWKMRTYRFLNVFDTFLVDYLF